jgi:hypothetical protein
MTNKQLKYFKLRLENPTRNKKDCAIEAGYSEKTAAHAKELIEDKIDDTELIFKMKNEGLTDLYLIKKLKEGINAEITKFFQKDGKVITKEDCIDFPTREKYLDMALKLKNLYPSKDINLMHSGKIETNKNPFDGVSKETKEKMLKLMEKDNAANIK